MYIDSVCVCVCACVCVQHMFDEVSTTGLGRFEDHVHGICEFYRKQRDVAVELAHKHLGGKVVAACCHPPHVGGVTHDVLPDLVSFEVPAAGMFLWMKLTGVSDSFELIKEKAAAANVRTLLASRCCPCPPPPPTDLCVPCVIAAGVACARHTLHTRQLSILLCPGFIQHGVRRANGRRVQAPCQAASRSAEDRIDAVCAL